MCAPCVKMPVELEVGAGTPGTQAVMSYELSSYGCWESNWGFLKQQRILLTAEPPLWLLGHLSFQD